MPNKKSRKRQRAGKGAGEEPEPVFSDEEVPVAERAATKPSKSKKLKLAHSSAAAPEAAVQPAQQQQQQQQQQSKNKKKPSQDSKSGKSSGVAAAADQGVNMAKYINKQRTLVFSSRGITHAQRHLMKDLIDLMPHSKKDSKLDTKNNLHMINEVADLKNCNNTLFFEARRKKDLYMWMSKTPQGPSAKFLVLNTSTMSETKLTGNCLKGSRPVLIFDQSWEEEPQFRLLKTMFTQVFGAPKGHPKVKPFVDHAMCFFRVNDLIWFRNFQIVHDPPGAAPGADPVLVEIGPRFVLKPIRMFAGSCSGLTLWSNPNYVTPTVIRRMEKNNSSQTYNQRQFQKTRRAVHEVENPMPEDPLEKVFE